MRTFFVLDRCYEYQNSHHGPVSHPIKKMDKKQVDVLLYDLHVSRFASFFFFFVDLDFGSSLSKGLHSIISSDVSRRFT